MATATATAPALSEELQALLCRLVDKPLAFVLWAYPWGDGALREDTGPDAWQREALLALEDELRQRDTAAQLAIASGHGIGKGALVSWVMQWAMATRPHLQGVVTANTQSQLFTKTWRELAKWHRLLRPELKALFTWTGTRYYHALAPDTWYVAAIPWSERNSEAFQGAHDKYVLLAFDESSAIPDPIWEASDGSMTTPRAIRLATGNPTRTEGRFRQCFPGGRFAHRWRHYQVDSRTCKQTNKTQLQQWVDDYGEDSDYVKVRVRGLFPSASVEQFISAEVIAAAQRRFRDGLPDVAIYPKVLGVDVARFGDDASVLRVRQGPKLYPAKVYRDMDTMRLAGFVVEAIEEYEPAMTFIDVVGIGAGVYDRVVQLGYGKRTIAVNGADAAKDWKRWHNKRAEMWADTRAWLKDFGTLDPQHDEELAAELQQPHYYFDGKQRLVLESKDDTKARGLASPDDADALTLTFAAPVAMPAPKPVPAPRPVAAALRGQGWMR